MRHLCACLIIALMASGCASVRVYDVRPIVAPHVDLNDLVDTLSAASEAARAAEDARYFRAMLLGLRTYNEWDAFYSALSIHAGVSIGFQVGAEAIK